MFPACQAVNVTEHPGIHGIDLLVVSYVYAYSPQLGVTSCQLGGRPSAAPCPSLPRPHAPSVDDMPSSPQVGVTAVRRLCHPSTRTIDSKQANRRLTKAGSTTLPYHGPPGQAGRPLPQSYPPRPNPRQSQFPLRYHGPASLGSRSALSGLVAPGIEPGNLQGLGSFADAACAIVLFSLFFRRLLLHALAESLRPCPSLPACLPLLPAHALERVTRGCIACPSC